jgi:hypothetical protein
MASVEDLPADQQAVLRLLHSQDRSYDQIAGQLGMAPAAVRDRAHDALIALGPQDSPLGRERRGQVADYLLGQGSGADRDSVRDLLRTSPSARAWGRSVSAQLEPLADGPLPSLGDGEAASEPKADADALVDDASATDPDPLVDDAPKPAAKPAASLQRASSRRGGMLLLGGLALLAALAIGFFVGRATKDSGDDSKAASTQASGGALTVLGQTNLKPPAGTTASGRLGIAQFVQRKGSGKNAGQKLLNVLAQGLPKAPSGSGYGVWLTKQGLDPVWLGYFQAVTSSGEVGAQSPLTVDPKNYERVILTRQRGQQPKTPGTVYLQGPISITG